jgi:hypothetical protein
MITENEISYKIRGTIFAVYNKVGPGLLNPHYEADYLMNLKCGLEVKTK